MGCDGVTEKDVVECSDSSKANRVARDADLFRYAMVDLFRRKIEVIEDEREAFLRSYEFHTQYRYVEDTRRRVKLV
jgi:hypothetical protein